MKKLVPLLIIAWLVSSCSTAPKSPGQHTDTGIWAGKVQMTNQQTSHRKWANVTWASDSDQDRMRVDVSAILDVPIATFIKNEEGSHLWLFTEKKYFFSKDGEKLFQFLTKLSVNPNIFYKLLGVPESPGTEWNCESQPQLFKCFSRARQTQFSVVHADPNQRVIQVEKGPKTLRVRLSRSKVQLQDRLFKKLSTSQFKTFRI